MQWRAAAALPTRATEDFVSTMLNSLALLPSDKASTKHVQQLCTSAV